MIFWQVVLMCNSPDNLYWHAVTICFTDLFKYTLCDSYNISTSACWHVFLLCSCDIAVITFFWLLWRLILLALCLWPIRNMLLLLDVDLGSLVSIKFGTALIISLTVVIRWRSVWFVYSEGVWIPLKARARTVMIEFKYWFWSKFVFW